MTGIGREALFDDERMSSYLRDGYVVLAPGELPASFHEEMFDAACAVHDDARAIGGDSNHLQVIGDNLRARIPALDRLLDCDTVQGALTSVLGEGFVLHPHHFVHEATPNDQSFHQDGNLPWNERAHYRTHRPNWAMLFYYPQRVTEESGPTEVLPGTQYWTTDFELEDGTWHRGDAADKTLRREELANADLAARDRRIGQVVDLLGVPGLERRRLTVEAGSLVLANYDLFHRGTRASVSAASRRFMYKFYYFRTQEPREASWRNGSASPIEGAAGSPVDGVVESIWQWLRGGGDECRMRVSSEDPVSGVENAAAENERVQFAYELGLQARDDHSLLPELERLLATGPESVRRAMGYALGVAGPPAEGVVLRALKHDDARVRRVACLAAAEGRFESEHIVAGLFRGLEEDPDDLVRSNAAYSLGNIARVVPERVPAALLLARLEPGVEAENSANGGMTRSTVRESVAYALNNVRLDAADLDRLAELGLADHDRYVRGLAITALERHVGACPGDWVQRFVMHLSASRFSERPPRPALASG
ncbi:MAG: phytanoyl-CoA dioxygenase family protein [Gammaproteobacteria bacterium]|nr:phytanoyl-CoA dioxygenase family protein [Gammaproteobacteria bacterium]